VTFFRRWPPVFEHFTVVRAVPKISDANFRDLSQLCDEFELVELAKTVGDCQAEHPLIDPVIRHALEERLEGHDRTMLMVGQALHRWRETAASDAEKLSVMEAEV
jgi:hypothetical protein